MTFMNLVAFVHSLMRTRTELAAENLALRQQLAALHRQSKRPRLKKRDRIFWVWFSRLFRNWRSVLVIVQPAIAPASQASKSSGHATISRRSASVGLQSL